MQAPARSSYIYVFRLGTQKAPQMSLKSIQELPKLIFGENAYFIALAMKNLLFDPPKAGKMSQHWLKVQEKHELGKRRAPDTDFWRFLVIFGIPGESKKNKNKKMPFRNRLEKRRQKRRRTHPWRCECGGLRAASRNARFLLRKTSAKIS